MCRKCEAKAKLAEIIENGSKLIALASQDDSTVLIYGEGVFEKWDFPPGVGPLDEDSDEYRDIAHAFEQAESPEQRRAVRVALAANGFTGEQMAQMESDLDERQRQPISERVQDFWKESEQVPYVKLNDGEIIWGATMGPAGEAFDDFVAGRTVVEVPFFGASVDAE